MRHIQHGYFPFSHTNFWRYPNGFDFQRGFDFYLPILIGLSFRFALSIPLSYNLTVLTLMTLNGLFSYLYFSRLSRSKLLGAVGAVMYGFSFYTIAKAGSHPNLLFVGGIPLLLYSLLRIYRSIIPSVKDYAILVGGILFIALGSVQYTILTSMMLTFYFIISYLLYPQETRFFFGKILGSYKNMIYPFLIGAAVIAVFYAPIITALLNGQIYVTNRDKTLFQETPNILDFVLPNNYLHLYIAKIFNNPSNPSIERAVFMGFIEIGLFIAFFFSKISKKLKKYIFSIFLIPLLLSFGYGRDNSFFLLPYHLLGHIFPFILIS